MAERRVTVEFTLDDSEWGLLLTEATVRNLWEHGLDPRLAIQLTIRSIIADRVHALGSAHAYDWLNLDQLRKDGE